MVSILAFDNNSVKALLSEKHKDYFEADGLDFPLFYKNRYSTFKTVKGKDKR